MRSAIKHTKDDSFERQVQKYQYLDTNSDIYYLNVPTTLLVHVLSNPFFNTAVSQVKQDDILTLYLFMYFCLFSFSNDTFKCSITLSYKLVIRLLLIPSYWEDFNFN